MSNNLKNSSVKSLYMENLMENHYLNATIVDIAWERVTVFLDVLIEFSEKADIEKPITFYAVNGAYKARAIFRQESLNRNIYKISLNVTNPGNACCVPTGNYSIVVCQGNQIQAVAETDVHLALKLQDYSRNFIYSGKARRKTYSVTFLVKEWTETLPFVMHILHAKNTGMGNIYSQPQKKKNFFAERINKLKKDKRKYAFKFLQSMYNYYRKKYKSNKNYVLFLYEGNYNMASNLKAVEKRMRERKIDKEFTILECSWYPDSRSKYTLHERISHQRILMKNLAMANVVFVDNYVPAFTRVKIDLDNTVIINLWHAGIGFKAVGYSRWGHIAAPAPYLGHRVYTYGVCGSKKVSHIFAEAWGINSERVLPTGMPRMDKFLDKSYREKKTKELYDTYPICKRKKVILFAPTFRGSNHPDAHYPYEILDFDRLYDFCGNDYILLFKMHPWISKPVPIEKYSDRFLDVTGYSDINDLFYITDLLITDYSSCIYEFSLMRKPILFFAFDELQYSISRGFHNDYRSSAPGKVCNTFDELLTAMKNKDFEFEKLEQYIERNFDVIDTNSSDRVIDWFLLNKIPRQFSDEIDARDKEMRLLYEQLDFTSLKSKANK